MFSEVDLAQMAQHGVTESKVLTQVEGFKNGFDSLNVVEAATINNGIISLNDKECEEAVDAYDSMTNINKVKFVPASGAATRMFKDLFEFVNDGKRSAIVSKLLMELPNFAFYNSLLAYVDLMESDDKTIVEAILSDNGLGYGSKPKGQLIFHKYDDDDRTAVEEHLVEGALYDSSNGVVNIHFTVSPEHQAGFESIIESTKTYYEAKFGVKYNISYSQQQSSTDTIAVNQDNTPFRNEDGSLLFRPAGHGALIENLNAIDADIIFIKNIDNVTTDRFKGDTITYKKALAAILVQTQAESFKYLENMESQEVTETVMDEISDFIQTKLMFKLPMDIAEWDSAKRADYLKNILNRPMRVCAMVRNEGEPGGGPFWISRADGAMSLQIAEPSQIASDKIDMLKNGTHFNPADLICGVKNYKGEKFDLTQFVDPNACFISEKSKNGKPLKAMELPGLWNGAMSNWSTIFVETPVSTFTPVKVVTDLLREQHQ